MAQPQNNLKSVLLPTSTTILNIECKKAFEELTLKEKLYSYYFSRASWAGAKICYFQRSYESPALFYVFQKIFFAEKPEEIRQKLLSDGFTTEEVQQLFVYLAAFLQNCGNYKSFGDTKFIPELPKERFWRFITLSKAYTQEDGVTRARIDELWNLTNLELYEFAPPYYLIEMPSKGGSSSYYSSNVTQEEAQQINEFIEARDVSTINTRIIKVAEKEFQVLVASASKFRPDEKLEHNGLKISIVYGDFAEILEELNNYLAKCLHYAANEDQRQMLVHYLQHFNSGDMNEHKESQRWWIKDKGPAIETNLGFIETYLDPLKVRAEFEGFVSIVNKKESQKLNLLVEKAESLISQLPWPKEFEVEQFKRPDFTSLEILTFACSGTPIGINIPNYDDIRQNFGFKNVNLGNVYGKPKKENVQFTPEHLKDQFVLYFKESLFVIVALHELLGHGTGKLLKQNTDGTFNFDQASVLNPFTNAPVATYYGANDSWHSKFGEISSGYEECKADAVALYLALFQEALDILIPEFTPEQQRDIVYIAWYEIIYSAIKGLQFYDPQQKKWGQAHVRASFAILQVLLRAGEGLVKIETIEHEGKPYLNILLDKEKIWTVGKTAIGDFIKHLQVYKSIADVAEGTKFFEEFSTVDEVALQYREIAVAHKLPRAIELQHDVQLVGKDQDVQYVQFNDNFDGVIESQVFHYGGNLENVYTTWKQYHTHFRLPAQNAAAAQQN